MRSDSYCGSSVSVWAHRLANKVLYKCNKAIATNCHRVICSNPEIGTYIQDSKIALHNLERTKFAWNVIYSGYNAQERNEGQGQMYIHATYQHLTLANHLKHASLSEENAGFSARLSHTCTDAHRKIRCTCSQPTAQDSNYIYQLQKGCCIYTYVLLLVMDTLCTCRTSMCAGCVCAQWQPRLREIKNSRLDEE